MQSPKKQRRGATALETSIILILFLTVTMGMLDVGVGVFRYHVLANAARHGARRAIVHGENADVLGDWYSVGLDGTPHPATANGIDIVDAIKPLLVGCDLPNTTVTIDWLNDSSDLEDPVRVTVTSPYQPVVSYLIPFGSKSLSASSTMQIAH